VQITHWNSGLWLANEQKGLVRTNKIVCFQMKRTTWMVQFFPDVWYACISSAWASQIFSCISLISNHMIFILQIIWNKWALVNFFKRLQIAWAHRASAILVNFEKIYLCSFIPNNFALEIIWLPNLMIRFGDGTGLYMADETSGNSCFCCGL